MSDVLKVAVIGLGARGMGVYMRHLSRFPDQVRLIAVADIDPERVRLAREQYGIEEAMCFPSGEALLAGPKLADCVLICSQDADHVRQAVQATKKGYDILLEKPISPSLKECLELLRVSKQYGNKIIVCHVLRYTPFYSRVHQLVRSGVLGKIVSIQAAENVGYWHQTHSFVRGNWRSAEETSPMILAKCCHDMDIFSWLLERPCVSVSSYGSLSYFREECAPEGAAAYCLEGCEIKDACPYDAEKLYVFGDRMGFASGSTDWLKCLTNYPTRENVYHALRHGPYGRCVFYCDNDVVDHQVVNMLFEGGETISFSMCAFSKEVTRDLKIMGTLGELRGSMEKDLIEIDGFGRESVSIHVNESGETLTGHSGGDAGLVRDFVRAMRTENLEELESVTTLERSMQSHFIALAAEKSRKSGGSPVNLQKFREEAE